MVSWRVHAGAFLERFLRPFKPHWFGHPLARVKEHLAAHPDDVTVHIGPGFYYPGTPEGIDITPGHTHVCFEARLDAHRNYFWSRHRLDSAAVFAIHPSEADGSQTGLPSACADRVLLNNVLTDMNPEMARISSRIDQVYRQLDHFSSKELEARRDALENEREEARERAPVEKKKLLQEAFRVLKPGGELWVGNTLIPEEMPLDDLLDWGRELGFNSHVVLRDSEGLGLADETARRKFSQLLGGAYAEKNPKLWHQFERVVRLQTPFLNRGFHLVRFLKPTI